MVPPAARTAALTSRRVSTRTIAAALHSRGVRSLRWPRLPAPLGELHKTYADHGRQPLPGKENDLGVDRSVAVALDQDVEGIPGLGRQIHREVKPEQTATAKRLMKV